MFHFMVPLFLFEIEHTPKQTLGLIRFPLLDIRRENEKITKFQPQSTKVTE
jgi:hypothetical protein